MQGKKKLCKLNTALYVCSLVFYAGLLTYLYYNQLTHEGIGPFESDTVVHYKMGAEDHYFYSLSSYLYYVLSLLPFSKQITAFFLAVMSAVTVYITSLLIVKVFSDRKINVSDITVNVLSLCLNFVMPFYVKWAHYKHYIGYQSANMWHNSTYMLMRVFALLTVLVFLRVYESYREKMSVRDWLLIAVFLMIASGIKSSFLTVFAPMMAIMLLVDLIRGTKFIRVFVMGCTVLPSIACILWQSVVLFDDGNSGIAFAPFKVLSERSSNPKLTVILSVLFPVLVLLFHIRDFYKDRVYLGSLIMWAVGFCWVFFLTETGTRSVDGNFMWGYSISLFFLFIISTLKVIEDIKSDAITVRAKIIRMTVLIPVFAWHLISGIWFFVLLLMGNTYFI